MLFNSKLLALMYVTLSGIKSKIENDNIIVADIDKNKGIYSRLFNFGINMNIDPKRVPKPAIIDNIYDICMFILKYIKKR